MYAFEMDVRQVFSCLTKGDNQKWECLYNSLQILTYTPGSYNVNIVHR